jgi:hypothetical protein
MVEWTRSRRHFEVCWCAMAASREASDLFDRVLMLVELTELAQRVPAGVRELWALDCARRTVAADILALRPHVRMLRSGLAVAASHLAQRLAAPTEPLQREAFEHARLLVHECLEQLQQRSPNSGPGHAQAVAAVSSVLLAMRCADGHADHEATARTAQAAFEHPDEEAGNQARRLLLRSKLIPSGAELLVRLDYAEAHGALPRAPEQLEWLNAQRGLLMNEDHDGRLAVVFRHLDRVFLAELSLPPQRVSH